MLSLLENVYNDEKGPENEREIIKSSPFLLQYIELNFYLFRIFMQINRYAFSGGQDSVEKHRQYGANLDVFFSSSFSLPPVYLLSSRLDKN